MAYLTQPPKNSLTAINPFVRPPPAPEIARPVVQGPDPGLYTPPSKLPDVVLPNRSDFGIGGGGMAGVSGSDPADLAQARKDAAGFRGDYNDPTHSSAFANLMGLASEKTGQATSEAARVAQDATSRAGYAGGFNQAAKQAEVDRMHSLSDTGFAGAAKIRGEALQGYGVAEGAVTELSKTANLAMTQMNIAFGDALSKAHLVQAEQNLGFADIVSKYQLGYADAVSARQQLQAKLDSAYNDQLISQAKYNQMNASLENEWNLSQQKFKEQQREFNIESAANTKKEADSYNLGMQGVGERRHEFDASHTIGGNPNPYGSTAYWEWQSANVGGSSFSYTKGAQGI